MSDAVEQIETKIMSEGIFIGKYLCNSFSFN